MLTARGAPLALLVVFLAIGGTVLLWVRIDQRPPAWDYADHLERMVACADDLAAGRLRAILERSSFYPPLVPCTASRERLRGGPGSPCPRRYRPWNSYLKRSSLLAKFVNN